MKGCGDLGRQVGFAAAAAAVAAVVAAAAAAAGGHSAGAAGRGRRWSAPDSWRPVSELAVAE